MQRVIRKAHFSWLVAILAAMVLTGCAEVYPVSVPDQSPAEDRTQANVSAVNATVDRYLHALLVGDGGVLNSVLAERVRMIVVQREKVVTDTWLDRQSYIDTVLDGRRVTRHELRGRNLSVDGVSAVLKGTALLQWRNAKGELWAQQYTAEIHLARQSNEWRIHVVKAIDATEPASSERE